MSLNFSKQMKIARYFMSAKLHYSKCNYQRFWEVSGLKNNLFLIIIYFSFNT